MKKQVTLEKNEYESLINLLVVLVNIVDTYTFKENKKLKGITHVVDTDKCDPFIKESYSKLLWLDDSIKTDVIEKLPKDYFETIVGQQSVLYDSNDVLF